MENETSRRQFMHALGALGLAGFAGGLSTAFVGCGGGSESQPRDPGAGQQPGTTPPPAPAQSRCETVGTTYTISDTAHVLMVTKEDVVAGVDKSYHIMGSANHDHTVEVTAADFASLQAGTPVTINSSLSSGGPVASHFHTVQVMCA